MLRGEVPAIKKMALSMATRIEKDSMGKLEVPSDAYYGIQTQRAVINFPISGWKTHHEKDPSHGFAQLPDPVP